nr:unnamed protein product [Digitaria exilis]
MRAAPRSPRIPAAARGRDGEKRSELGGYLEGGVEEPAVGGVGAAELVVGSSASNAREVRGEGGGRIL